MQVAVLEYFHERGKDVAKQGLNVLNNLVLNRV